MAAPIDMCMFLAFCGRLLVRIVARCDGICDRLNPVADCTVSVRVAHEQICGEERRDGWWKAEVVKMMNEIGEGACDGATGALLGNAAGVSTWRLPLGYHVRCGH